MRMSLFVHEFSAGVRTRCLCCMQPHLEIRACSINIRMQTSASCDVESAAWARTEVVFALVNSVGRDATAADVGGATSLQLMLKRLNRRALSAWRSNGKAERRSRRICRTLTTAASMTMRAARSMSNDPSFAHIRCAQSGSVRGDVLQSGACPTVLANSDANAPAGQKSPLEAFSDRFFCTGSDHYGLPSLLPPLLPPLSSSSSPSPPFLLLPPPSSAEILKLSHQHRKKADRGSLSVLVRSFKTYPQCGPSSIRRIVLKDQAYL